MRGAAPMNVGFTDAQLSTIFSTRPSTAVAKPQASCVESSTLPKEWAIGSQRNCRSSSLRMFWALMAPPSKTQEEWRSRTPLGRPVVPEV